MCDGGRCWENLADCFVEGHRVHGCEYRANVSEGSSPLSVFFTSVGSIIRPAKYTGSQPNGFDGNGVANSPSTVSCAEKPVKAAMSCVYPRAGSYAVTLRINSKEGEHQTAAGVAVLNLNVSPPNSKINLTVQSTTEKQLLYGFDKDGELAASQPSFQITLTEAKAGLIFDANETVDSSGSRDGITLFEWNFGDNSEIVSTKCTSHRQSEKIYSQTGIYPLKLEVTDKFGNKDRVFVNINTQSHHAR